MKVQFVTQPFADGYDLSDFLEAAGQDTSFTQLQASVAWAKRSGLARVRPNLDAIAERGAVQLIIGIGEGGATRQGLELALEISSEVYVFHDPTGRTFHPKVYLGTGTENGLLLAGSHNLTAGGAYFNYEAGIMCQLEFTKEPDQRLADDVRSFFSRLISDQEVCLRLDHQLLADLIADPVYRIGDEDAHRKSAAAGTPDDTDSVTGDETGRTPIFGRSKSPKRSRAAVQAAERTRPNQRPAQARATRPPRHAVKRWWKKMSGSDAQHPPQPTSAVTGALRLAKAGHPIDHTTYFRNDFFGDAHWETAGTSDPTYEKCFVEMDVDINGTGLGVMPFRVDYKPGRIAGQGNISTVLKWGGLGARLRSEDHASEFTVLERLADGTYRLSIQAGEPQDFMA